jgi:hypothetical protein
MMRGDGKSGTGADRYGWTSQCYGLRLLSCVTSDCVVGGSSRQIAAIEKGALQKMAAALEPINSFSFLASALGSGPCPHCLFSSLRVGRVFQAAQSV